MRRLLQVGSVFAVAVAIGCAPPATPDGFADVVMVHFSALNNEGELARQDAIAKLRNTGTSVHALPSQSTGRQYNTFSWHPDGMILEDIECGKCRTRQTIVSYRGEDVPCSSCGSPDRDKTTGQMTSPLIRRGLSTQQLLDMYQQKARPMFEMRRELAKGNKEMVAIVRYTRSHWVVDDLGKIEISEKGLARAGNPPKFDAGYHRPDATYICTTAFYYSSGKAEQIDSASVMKMLKGETADRKLWKFGSTMAIEQPVRPWDAPRSLQSPSARGN